MAIFLAVTLSQRGETVLTMVDKPLGHLKPSIYKANTGKYQALLGPFPSPLSARYIWWLWARRGLKQMTSEIIASAEQAAQDDDDPLWQIERDILLAEAGMTPEERDAMYADMAAEYEPDKFIHGL